MQCWESSKRDNSDLKFNRSILMDYIILSSADSNAMSSFTGFDKSNNKAWGMARAARWKLLKEKN